MQRPTRVRDGFESKKRCDGWTEMTEKVSVFCVVLVLLLLGSLTGPDFFIVSNGPLDSISLTRLGKDILDSTRTNTEES